MAVTMKCCVALLNVVALDVTQFHTFNYFICLSNFDIRKKNTQSYNHCQVNYLAKS